MKDLQRKIDRAMKYYMYYTMKLSDPTNTREDREYCLQKATQWETVKKELSEMMAQLKNSKKAYE